MTSLPPRLTRFKSSSHSFVDCSRDLSHCLSVLGWHKTHVYSTEEVRKAGNVPLPHAWAPQRNDDASHPKVDCVGNVLEVAAQQSHGRSVAHTLHFAPKCPPPNVGSHHWRHKIFDHQPPTTNHQPRHTTGCVAREQGIHTSPFAHCPFNTSVFAHIFSTL